MGWRDLKEKNDALENQVQSMQQAKKASDVVLTKLSENQAILAGQYKTNLGAIYALRKSTKAIEDFLDQSVPSNISGVLKSSRARDTSKLSSEVSGIK